MSPCHVAQTTGACACGVHVQLLQEPNERAVRWRNITRSIAYRKFGIAYLRLATHLRYSCPEQTDDYTNESGIILGLEYIIIVTRWQETYN
jgi:hypothetical protein